MEIKKVITPSHYKKKYVFIDHAILEEKMAKIMYPHRKEEINQVLNDSDTKDTVKVTQSVYPSNQEMLDFLLKERTDIYNNLNLKALKGKENKLAKSLLLFLHLSKRVNYDMTTSEDYATGLLEVEEEVMNIFASLMNNEEELGDKEKQKELETISYLKGLYNVFKNGRGTCYEFSNAYQFLLEGVNIKALTAMLVHIEDDYAHAINLVKEGTHYYIVDVTRGNETFKDDSEFLDTSGFVEEKTYYFYDSLEDEYFEVEKTKKITNKFEQLQIEKITNRTVLETIHRHILKENCFEYEIDQAIDFIMNGYKPVEKENEEAPQL